MNGECRFEMKRALDCCVVLQYLVEAEIRWYPKGESGCLIGL